MRDLIELLVQREQELDALVAETNAERERLARAVDELGLRIKEDASNLGRLRRAIQALEGDPNAVQAKEYGHCGQPVRADY